MNDYTCTLNHINDNKKNFQKNFEDFFLLLGVAESRKPTKKLTVSLV